MYRLQKYFFLNRVEETGCLEGDFFGVFFVPYFSRVIFFLTYMVNIPKGIFLLILESKINLLLQNTQVICL